MLSDIITQGVQEYADRIALIFHDTPITYAQLGDSVDQLAAGLGELGIGRGDRISLLLPNSPAFVYGYFASAAIDAVVVPVNPLLKPAELQYIWNDAAVSLAITIPALLPAVLAARASLPQLRHVVCVGSPTETALPAEQVDGLLWLQEVMQRGAAGLSHGLSAIYDQERQKGRQEDDCAVVIYTSGTTGYPKGAMLSHRNLMRNVEQVRAAIQFTSEDRFITLLPLFHAFAGTVCMNVCLAAGCTSLLMESFVPARVVEAIRRHGITVFPAVPAMFNALLLTGVQAADVVPLRIFVSGGAPLPETTLSALEERFGIPVLEGDGPTECSPVTSVNPEDGPRKAGSVGPPVPGVEIAIFDDEDRPLPAEAIGEIVVRGDNVMLGYLNQPEATAEAMRGGWYHTGDLGKIDSDGYVYIVDRKKDMVITSGLNVYPREVEEALLAHPAVADAAVVGLPDPMRGESVTAIVVKRPDAEATERELLRHCRERLANYKVPQRLLFRDSLPRGGTGKVLKRLLKKELEMEQPSDDSLKD